MMYVCTYVPVMLRNVAVMSRRNVANQRSYVIIIARKEGGAWEHTPQTGARARERRRWMERGLQPWW